MVQNQELPIKTDPSIKEVIKSIRNTISFLLSKWLIILILTIVGGVLGFLYTRSLKNKYEAVCSFVIDSKDKGAGGLGISVLGLNVGGGSVDLFGDIENIKWLYLSNFLIEQTLMTDVERPNGTKTKLITWYIEQAGLKKDLDKSPKLKGVSFENATAIEKLSEPQSQVLKMCSGKISKESLKVSDGGRRTENIIVTNVVCNDEIFTKVFSDTWVKTVNVYFVTTKTSRAKHEIKVLQGKTDSIRREMDRSITRVAASIDNTPFANPSRQINTVTTAKSKVDVAVLNAVYEELVKNLEINKLSLLKQTPLIQVVDEPRLPLSVKRTTALKGMITGAFIFAFLTILTLLGINLYKRIMQ